MVHQAPSRFGVALSRWTLALLGTHVPALRTLRSVSGVWRRLQRWRIRWRRGRLHVTSPDPAYQEKLTVIGKRREAVRAAPEAMSVFYVDEYTCFRQPTVGAAWHEAGRGGAQQKRARLAHAANSYYRFVAALDVQTGAVTWKGNSRIGVSQLVAFLKQLRRRYGPGRQLVVIWDNWPMHAYDQVRETAAAEQIELLALPTYAPWTNPIEKLWRKLKEEVLRMHELSEDWAALKQRVRRCLEGHETPSPDLLRYVGLLPD